jgi:hypothetical protein
VRLFSINIFSKSSNSASKYNFLSIFLLLILSYCIFIFLSTILQKISKQMAPNVPAVRARPNVPEQRRGNERSD